MQNDTFCERKSGHDSDLTKFNGKNMINAKVIEDSVSPEGFRLTTMQLMYPRFIHAEFMTHRVFSRNASSSRAIPVERMLQMLRNEPAMPIHWGKNRPGMQADEQLSPEAMIAAKIEWIRAAENAADTAERMMKLGLHKQVANRILEPFQHISVVVTSTKWQNYFELRAHPDAQPEIHALAVEMREARDASTPSKLEAGDWHLPYITHGERNGENIKLAKVSAARCARVSYLKHDGCAPNISEDFALYERLVGLRPMHASPVEHQATPDNSEKYAHLCGNFTGWIQFRKLVEQELL